MEFKKADQTYIYRLIEYVEGDVIYFQVVEESNNFNPHMNINALTFLVVDDNLSFIQLLEITLKSLGATKIIKATNVLDGYNCFLKHDPDICLLDISLSEGTKDGAVLGLDIRKKNPSVPIIFFTSYFQQDFYDAVKGVGPSGFMSKELSQLKVQQAIELATLQIREEKPVQRVIAPPKENNRASFSGIPPVYFNDKQIFFKVGDSFKPIDVKQIDFFYAENKLTYARIGLRNFPTSVQLKVLEEELAPKFLRCHKKYLVNVDRIESIDPRDGKVSIGKQSLTIGYAYRKAFLKGLHLIK